MKAWKVASFTSVLWLAPWLVSFFAVAGPVPSATPLSVPRRAVVLIPGTLNMIAPGHFKWDSVKWVLEVTPYFSIDVVDAFEKEGLAVYVVRNLALVGDFLENGKKAASEIRTWYRGRFPTEKTPITLIGHSAGGFYALAAAQELIELPVDEVVCIGTPLKGSELADRLFESKALGPILKRSAKSIEHFFDFRGIAGITRSEVQSFLERLSFPKRVRVETIAGEQPSPEHFREMRDPHRLSPLWALVQLLIPKPSDGMVTVESAWGEGLSLHSADGGSQAITPLRTLAFDLDHSEQVFDYRLFKVLGIRDVEWIQSEQQRLYRALAQKINPPINSAPLKR